jgi:hypothetical protein
MNKCYACEFSQNTNRNYDEPIKQMKWMTKRIKKGTKAKYDEKVFKKAGAYEKEKTEYRTSASAGCRSSSRSPASEKKLEEIGEGQEMKSKSNEERSLEFASKPHPHHPA